MKSLQQVRRSNISYTITVDWPLCGWIGSITFRSEMRKCFCCPSSCICSECRPLLVFSQHPPFLICLSFIYVFVQTVYYNSHLRKAEINTWINKKKNQPSALLDTPLVPELLFEWRTRSIPASCLLSFIFHSDNAQNSLTSSHSHCFCILLSKKKSWKTK